MSELCNKLGKCALCQTQIAEIKVQFPLDHPLSGEARSIGKLLPNGRELMLVLSDSSYANVTVCDKCSEEPVILDDLWQSLVNAWKREMSNEYREAVGAKPLPAAQLKVQRDWLEKKSANYIVTIFGED